MVAGEMGRCAAPFLAMRFRNGFSNLISRLGGVPSLRLWAWDGRSGRYSDCEGVVADAVEIVSGMRRLRFACAWVGTGALIDCCSQWEWEWESMERCFCGCFADYGDVHCVWIPARLVRSRWSNSDCRSPRRCRRHPTLPRAASGSRRFSIG